MGDIYQLEYAKRHIDCFADPVLEVGSANYGTTQDFRELFDRASYLGIDMLDGPGVDMVLDLTQDFDAIDRALEGRRFRTIICLSVLEHCAQPFVMAQNMTRLLEPGGVIYISVPWVWKFHGYPSDYWRFTHEGVKLLFPELEFLEDRCNAHSGVDGKTYPLDEMIGRREFTAKAMRREGRWSQYLRWKLLKCLPFRWLTRHPYLMGATMINMIGRKPNA